MTTGKWMPAEADETMIAAGGERIVREYAESDWEEAKDMAEGLNPAQVYAAMYAVAPASPGPMLDERIEVAADARRLQVLADYDSGGIPWADMPEADRAEWRRRVRCVLLAAAPELFADSAPASPGPDRAALERIANWKTYRGWSQELDAQYETDEEKHLQQAYEYGANDAIRTLAAIARDALAAAPPGSEAPVTAEVRKVLEPFVAEFIRSTNPGDSDLDNEQPYHLVVPLGACRAARALLARWG